MRNIILSILLSLSFVPVFADEGYGTLELKTSNLYRGQELPTNDLAISGVFRLDDLFVDGLYLETDIHNLDVVDPNRLPPQALECLQNKTNILCSVSLNPMVHASVGYKTRLWGLMIDTSLARVFNPVFYRDDYFEIETEIQTDLELFRGLDVYSRIVHGFDGAEHWYVGTGVIAEDVFVDDLDFRGGVNFYHYDRALTWNDWTRNNYEFSVDYGVLDSVDLFAEWSIGHRGVNGAVLDNEYLFGVRFRF